MNFFLCFFVISKISLSVAQWSYDDETQWPGVCRRGKRQSPINIMSVDAQVDQNRQFIRGDLKFRGYRDVKLNAANTGFVLRWLNREGSPAPVLSGGPLHGSYSFLLFDLHWLSEHAIDGMKFPLEIQMVHVKTGLSFEDALKREDGFAVISVLCQVVSNSRHSVALGQIVKDLPNLAHLSEKEVESNVMSLSTLFSKNPQSYFTYNGSLTVPECGEVVIWIVMDQPVLISAAQYKIFGKVDIDSGRLENTRGLQPVNRVVIRSVASTRHG